MIDRILADEFRTKSEPVLFKPGAQIVRDADLERSVAATGQDVDVESIAQEIAPLREVYGSRIVARA